MLLILLLALLLCLLFALLLSLLLALMFILMFVLLLRLLLVVISMLWDNGFSLSIFLGDKDIGANANVVIGQSVGTLDVLNAHAILIGQLGEVLALFNSELDWLLGLTSLALLFFFALLLSLFFAFLLGSFLFALFLGL